jgi:hypothetical protein
MKKTFILLVSCVFLSACSHTDNQSSEYFLYAPIENNPDVSIVTKCLQQAGIPFKVDAKGVYIPENKGESATENCS